MDGNVYVLKHKKLKNIFIVGCTDKSKEDLAKEYSSHDNVSEPYELKIFFAIPDYKKAEQIIYKHLDKFRVSIDTKFFQTKLSNIIDVLSYIYYIYDDVINKYNDGLKICGDAYYKKNSVDMINRCKDNLKEMDYSLDTFDGIFKKDGKYYFSIMHHVFISRKEYLELVKQFKENNKEKQISQNIKEDTVKQDIVKPVDSNKQVAEEFETA